MFFDLAKNVGVSFFFCVFLCRFFAVHVWLFFGYAARRATSLLFAAGSHCIWQTLRHQWDLRFAVAGIAILTIGLGSIAYHSTLQYWAQLWDEVPLPPTWQTVRVPDVAEQL